MKVAKRILVGLLVFIVVVFAFLLVAPMIFKDEIVSRVKSGINEAVNAEVDFADADLSFLRSFPDIALTVDDYRIVGIDTFAGLPLLTGEQARIDLGFWSVIAGDGNYEVDGLTLTKPNVNLLVLTPELANYLIVAETGGADAGATATPESQPVITLQEFRITDGSLVYDDRTTETFVRLTGLNATGNGDFTASVFDLDTHAEAKGFTFAQAGMTYLDEVLLEADAVVNIDADNLRYTFKDNNVKLNELALVFGGSIDLEDNDDILLDLTYSAPANDFRQLWSIIPAAYTEGFERVQTGGTFTLSGDVKGTYNGEREVYPAFSVASDISNGSVQYPGRPVGITGIDAALNVNSPAADLDRMVVDLPRFDFTLGGDPFRGSFRLATPLSDPNVTARLNGTVDLQKWSSAIPLEGVQELAGRIVADVTMENVRQSAIDAGRYGEVNLAGDLLVSNLVYVAEGTPAVRIAQAKADFTPQFVDVQQFNATLGQSDLSATAKINNLLAYFSPTQTMRGSVVLRSNFFSADEWMAESTEEAVVSPAELETTSTPSEAEVFDRFDFDVDAEIEELAYGIYRPTDLRVVGNVKPNRLELATAAATLKESTFNASGMINNLFDYTFGEGVLTGDLSVRSGFFSVADFMDEEVVSAPTTSADASTAAAAPIPIPRNINLKVDMAADRVQYTDITMNAVRGIMRVRDGAVVIEDGRADLLGGSMGFTGAYDTAEGNEPGFHFSYDMKNLQFSQAFSVLNTFAILAPVGKFISGTFNSEMVMNGKLGADLFPQLKSIDAKGLLRTADARIASFKPLQVIGEALNIRELRESAPLKNLIAPFEINDGTVTVKPFDFTLAGIGMRMGGSSGLDTDMDYKIRAAVPRTLIQSNIVTGTALSALDKLAGQAGKLGLNITPGDTINLNISLTGSIANPRAAFDLLGTQGSGDRGLGGTVADAAKERLQEELNTRLDSAKTLAGDRARIVQDSLRTVAAEQARRLETEAANRLKGALGVGRDSAQVRDSLALPDAAKDAVDDVKKELEKFNPFKRKKTGGG
ncbi:AsmA-like C-terminal region-containing protein [Lewinella sp. JB7]|uniref:AsmA-like C-terminal region-containing protein n=1 Tax=Lewinella sp. JB7 TaxID=2962887 RepID=UPI0020CA0920|nr:AsmA-like C-terminal region-containing protein [Lewinella sp. JB7]MCP9235348.1 AsmA-like C-terminal region-containing protein [Lewinella sp. JB7]